MRVTYVPFLALLACTGNTDGDADKGTEGSDGELSPFETYINTEGSIVGTPDLGGITPGADWASTTWLTASADKSKQKNSSATLLVEDFESENPVFDATAEVWFDNVVEGTPDKVVNSSKVDGIAVFDALPTCTPFAYRVSTDPDLAETRVTISSNKIFGATTPIEDSFTSVSSTTYNLIPSLLGITVQPGKSIIAGTFYDADEKAIEGAQVVVYDVETGDIPEGYQVHYFQEEFPAKGQKTTSPDGLWVAINLPPGTLRVEAWGRVGDGELSLLGATVVRSYADSINLSNIFAGYGDGVWYPLDCRDAGGDADTDSDTDSDTDTDSDSDTDTDTTPPS
jgi:hypothetical protein